MNFVQIPKGRQELFVLLRVSRCESLGTRCPVCFSCRGLFTPSVKLDVHPCPSLTSCFTNLFFRKRFYGFSSCGLRGKGAYSGLFICQNDMYLFFPYFIYMYTFLIVLHSLKKCKPSSLLGRKIA